MKSSSLAICACILAISASAFAATSLPDAKTLPASVVTPSAVTTKPTTGVLPKEPCVGEPVRYDMTDYRLPSTEGYAVKKQIAVDDMVFSPDIKPIMIHNTTLVPARAVADALGFTTTWNDGTTPSITIASKTMETTLTFGVDLSTATSTIAIGMTAPISYGAPAVLVGNTAYVPLSVFRVIQGNSPDAIVVTDTGISIRNVESR